MLKLLRRGILLSLLPLSLHAQFRNLTTTDDGSRLAFSSTLRLTGTLEVPYDKLFILDSSGLSLYSQSVRTVPDFHTFDKWTNYYQKELLEWTGDGIVGAVVSRRDCVIGISGCALDPTKYGSEITPAVVLTGQARLSRNGRYAFLSTGDTQALGSGQFRDLSTGAFMDGPYQALGTPAHRFISSAGVAVVATLQKRLEIFTSTGLQQILTSAQTIQSVVDDNAFAAVYEGQLPSGKLLSRVDLATQAETVLIEAPDLTLVGETNDGGIIAFLAATKLTGTETNGLPQLFIISADGSGLRQLTRDPAGITEAVLSGNGNAAYAVTAAGRLVQIDPVSARVTERIGRTVMLSGFEFDGSIVCVTGTGLADFAALTAAPFPVTLNGLQLLLDGRPLPLQSVTPAKACFQVPEGTPTGSHILTAVTDSDPRFEGSSAVPFSVFR